MNDYLVEWLVRQRMADAQRAAARAAVLRSLRASPPRLRLALGAWVSRAARRLRRQRPARWADQPSRSR